jgi:hypothetical protein
MRIQLDDIISELGRLLKNNKGLRNKVLLERALDSLKEYKKLNEKKVV